MTLFINLRASANGGIVADEASVWDNAGDGSTALSAVSAQEFAEKVAGRHVLFATHGFNVDQPGGIKALSTWSGGLQLPGSYLFVGVLWPGDSAFLPVIDYVYEGNDAIASGRKLATFLNKYATRAQSVSFASHSLGARTFLETINALTTNPRRVVLMAPAIENDCLSKEYANAAAKVSEIFVLASKSDSVLKWAFPAGNLVGEIVMHGHPYDRTALGRSGPAWPVPADVNAISWEIPQAWDYGHGDYLPKGVIGPAFPLPVTDPDPSGAIPGTQPPPDAWKPAWSAGVTATQTTSKG